MTNGVSRLIGLDPTSPATSSKSLAGRAVATRPLSLEGARVGLVANGLGRTEALFQAVYAEMAKLVKLDGQVAVLKPDISMAPPPADWQRLTTQATVAITGFGGCGSCSSRAMRDAMELEWAGVPAVALIHEALEVGVCTLMKLSGMPDYEFVLVRYPYAPLCDWTDEQIAEVARDVAPKIIDLLTRQAAATRAA
ncbi:MAG: hypothetical protein AB7Q97_24935 [Gammaproteobacteria bacterium]